MALNVMQGMQGMSLRFDMTSEGSLILLHDGQIIWLKDIARQRSKIFA